MNTVTDVHFPCERVPDDTRSRGLLGLYEQAQEGLFMLRIKVHSGRVTARQLRVLAQLANRHTPDYPLHVTTRQDFELHGVRPEDVPTVQREYHAVGLTSLGACGDTLRNVTACHGNGLCPNTFDISDVADAIRRVAESLPFIRALPRKFKVSCSGCEKACAKPWINDIGLVPQMRDGAFRAILGGSLGPRPGTGISLYENLSVAELVPLAVAALRLFNAEGDREKRAMARLRHVRERIGDDRFRQLLDDLFRKEKAESQWHVPRIVPVRTGKKFVTRMSLPLGDIRPDEALALADAAEKARAVIRIGLEHDVWLYSDIEPVLPDTLLRFVHAPRVVACPGSAWCKRGIADSRALALRLLHALANGSGLTIGISGCPNNCSQAAVSDIGLIGRVKTLKGIRTECYKLVAGGGNGLSRELAVVLHPTVPAELADRAVVCLAKELAARRRADERLVEVVAREREALVRGLAQVVGVDESQSGTSHA